MHGHDWAFIEAKRIEEGFSFHTKLSLWLQEYLSLPSNTLIKVYEVKCGENNCPVEEVKLLWDTGNGEESLQVGRGKEKILKQDVYLAKAKQKQG
ncbi:hypothetical protein LPTSP4_35320 [Leptospira ryugenii]|uniref:Uncharacterized protein n=1 Tax=Leptospira ryugenii TaxID=1917863 RepID=A0A2P2E555_9LEPT|nr:hypothetical protein [Leptospira ryugenii]GBF51994.1 hypothetical protein LPTSP4_35320 [Leptospira ryugenii]